AVPVAVTVATARDIVERVTLTGVTRARNEVNVFAKLPGRIEEVLVHVGDRVKAGQVLVVIERREVALQHDQAQAQLQAAVAGLDRARVALEAASAAYRRNGALREQDVVSQAAFEEVESAFREARAGAAAAEAQVATARAAAALAAEGLRNARVTTPIAGTVIRRFVDVGAQATPALPLFQIEDVGTIEVEGAAAASDFARLRVGQEARIAVNDLPGEVFRGRVSTLSPSLDPQTRRAAVEIDVSNAEGRLLPNMFAEATIEIGRKTTLAVPESAVVSSPSGRTIFVVRDGKAMEIRPRLGGIDTGFVAVESHLDAGDRVIVAGQTAIRSGAEVRPRLEGAGEAAAP
ncbi:MAG TPA: efflux RND transporter periplasmic adaptor subunit, partial [Actinomycetota bacterium]|nr:efflux RND transporter periplasmic adaptor subunit [Actinomycetota bacterium]